MASPAVQNQIRQYQEFQQQLQMVVAQRQQFEAQKRELERATNALEGDPSEVYRSAGPLLVRVGDVAAVRKELADQFETTELRLKSLARQQEALETRVKALEEKLQAALKQAGAGGAA